MSRLRTIKALIKSTRRRKSATEKFRTDTHGISRGSQGTVLFPSHISSSRGIKPMGPRPMPVPAAPVRDLPKYLKTLRKGQLSTSQLLAKIDRVNIQAAISKAKSSTKAKKPAVKSFRRKRRKRRS